MSIDTTQLLHRLSEARDIKTFLEENEQEFHQVTTAELLGAYAEQNGLSVSAIADRSGHGEYVYKVFRGERKPSRDVLIAIAFGMALTIDQTQLLLRITKMSGLDPRDPRDSILLYALKNKKSIMETNDLLYELKQQTL